MKHMLLRQTRENGHAYRYRFMTGEKMVEYGEETETAVDVEVEHRGGRGSWSGIQVSVMAVNVGGGMESHMMYDEGPRERQIQRLIPLKRRSDKQTAIVAEFFDQHVTEFADIWFKDFPTALAKFEAIVLEAKARFTPL